MNLIGLARKAGKTASGEFQTEKAVKSGHAFFVVLADDASDNTKKKFQNMCKWYHVPVAVRFTMEELGHCLGLAQRSSMAVTDEGFAGAVKKLIGNDDMRR